MKNNTQNQEERTYEEYTASFTNHFGASSFQEDPLEQALTDHFQKA